jgi:hypothetical protein
VGERWGDRSSIEIQPGPPKKGLSRNGVAFESSRSIENECLGGVLSRVSSDPKRARSACLVLRKYYEQTEAFLKGDKKSPIKSEHSP